MDALSYLLVAGGVIVGIVLLLKILSRPIKRIFKLVLNTVLGIVILALINFFGEPIGISITVNFLNALIVGILGVPGVILLLIAGFFL